MELNEIRDNEGARKKRMRVGRGIGCTKGKTCGRGYKGQTSRSGVAIKGFEGGQMPIHRRLPKRGFSNHARMEFESITFRDIQVLLDTGVVKAGDTITTELLKKNKVVAKTAEGVKLLLKGELKTKLNFDVERASKSAVEAVEKAGGKVTVKVKAVYPKGKQAKWTKKA
jgi:large subunit ribosomal protein L15